MAVRIRDDAPALCAVLRNHGIDLTLPEQVKHVIPDLLQTHLKLVHREHRLKFPVALGTPARQNPVMSELIYPRSARESMDGWLYLPRYVDKIRLHLAGKLHADYQENLGKGFDGLWLAHAGLKHETFVEMVKNTITDGEVCDWVRLNVKKTPAEKAAHAHELLNRPPAGDAAGAARLQMRKEQSGLGSRDDLKTFVDYIDADEKRL